MTAANVCVDDGLTVRNPLRRRWGAADHLEADKSKDIGSSLTSSVQSAKQVPDISSTQSSKEGKSWWSDSGWFAHPVEKNSVGFGCVPAPAKAEPLNITQSCVVPGGASAQNRFVGPGSKYIPKFVEAGKSGMTLKDEDDKKQDLAMADAANKLSLKQLSPFLSGLSGQMCVETQQGLMNSERQDWRFNFQSWLWELDGQAHPIFHLPEATNKNEVLIMEDVPPVSMKASPTTTNAHPWVVEAREKRLERFSQSHEEQCQLASAAKLSQCQGPSKRVRATRILPCQQTEKVMSRNTQSESMDRVDNFQDIGAQLAVDDTTGWTLYRCAQDTLVYLHEVDVTKDKVMQWHAGEVEWPAICTLNSSAHYREGNAISACCPGPKVSDQEAARIREDIVEHMRDSDVAQLLSDDAKSKQDEALQKLAAAMKSDTAAAAARTKAAAPEAAHVDQSLQLGVPNAEDDFVQKSGESVVWAERRRRQEVEAMLAVERKRCAQLEEALRNAGIEIPDSLQ
mmetsp:Transcript_16126/g.31060  ORF Transcript_16126/g.31060 Transcript_16126/m.31060 type:complete len:511 (-) Transcript_16126:277-1809(-)|eukprot:CAMPEP_0114283990 /NCGR_PEP_ID=MMETSP0059-20121206/4410_1 /TAXON_ID=36894 /ORGANISM="Pyramimonas parkeae, Strain CCMP726" /LENGTH=510 /DNA_ID=CAMNT_0001404783 /DNA_START=96 /DNA_END=1628 /DNA_ORIENTATION=+